MVYFYSLLFKVSLISFCHDRTLFSSFVWFSRLSCSFQVLMTSFEILSPVAPSVISFLIHFPYSICPFIEALYLFPLYMWICLHSYSWLVCALRSFVRRQHAKLPVRELGAATKLAHTGWLFFLQLFFLNSSLWNLLNFLFVLWVTTLKFLPYFLFILFPLFVKTIFTFDTPCYWFFPGRGPEKAHIVSQLPLVVNYSTTSKLLVCYEILFNL